MTLNALFNALATAAVAATAIPGLPAWAPTAIAVAGAFFAKLANSPIPTKPKAE